MAAVVEAMYPAVQLKPPNEASATMRVNVPLPPCNLPRRRWVYGENTPGSPTHIRSVSGRRFLVETRPRRSSILRLNLELHLVAIHPCLSRKGPTLLRPGLTASSACAEQELPRTAVIIAQAHDTHAISLVAFCCTHRCRRSADACRPVAPGAAASLAVPRSHYLNSASQCGSAKHARCFGGSGRRPVTASLSRYADG